MKLIRENGGRVLDSIPPCKVGQPSFQLAAYTDFRSCSTLSCTAQHPAEAPCQGPKWMTYSHSPHYTSHAGRGEGGCSGR